jgi:putative transposase
MNEKFDLNEALEQIKAGAKIDGKDGVLAPLIKELTEAALKAELESHLADEVRNRKNGKSSKRMKSSVGEFDLDVPRDRNGTFEPQIVKKHQAHMSDQIEQKILSLYALGNSYTQIRRTKNKEQVEQVSGDNYNYSSRALFTILLIYGCENPRQDAMACWE